MFFVVFCLYCGQFGSKESAPLSAERRPVWSQALLARMKNARAKTRAELVSQQRALGRLEVGEERGRDAEPRAVLLGQTRRLGPSGRRSERIGGQLGERRRVRKAPTAARVSVACSQRRSSFGPTRGELDMARTAKAKSSTTGRGVRCRLGERDKRARVALGRVGFLGGRWWHGFDGRDGLEVQHHSDALDGPRPVCCQQRVCECVDCLGRVNDARTDDAVQRQ